MKKKIANGLELLLLLASFIILWLPTLKVQHVDLQRELLIDVSALGLMQHGNVYLLFFLYAVTVLMCIISIFVKPEHRDGKMHVIMPIILFLYAVAGPNVEVGTVVDKFIIMESKFPVYLFLALYLGIIIISIAKRSSIIAGIPKVTVANHKTSTADELKKYKDLLDSGAITTEEYEEKKKHLL